MKYFRVDELPVLSRYEEVNPSRGLPARRPGAEVSQVTITIYI